MTNNVDPNNLFSYSFSLDCLIFTFVDQRLKVLLIRRNVEPFKNSWAIPGDLILPSEGLEVAAERILFQLTNISGVALHQSQTFGEPKRHPQGRVITCAYYALVRIDEVHVKASSWANDIKWVDLESIEDLAFDHNLILNSTVNNLKQKLINEPIAFDLLPVKFTLNELHHLYEFVYDAKLDKANFRKRLKNVPLKQLSEKQKGVKHRPAALFEFDRSAYEEMLKNTFLTFKI